LNFWKRRNELEERSSPEGGPWGGEVRSAAEVVVKRLRIGVVRTSLFVTLKKELGLGERKNAVRIEAARGWTKVEEEGDVEGALHMTTVG